MKMLNKTVLVVTVSLVSLALLSCGRASETASAAQNELATVQRGNLKTEITGVGNLALSRKVDLPFDIPAAFDKTVVLTVEEVLVTEGESVEEGQLLARLDTATWDDQVSKLEDKETAAERSLTTKERAVTTAEQQITTKELAVTQAELDIQTAEDALEQIADVKVAKDNLDRAQKNLDIAWAIAEATGIAPGSGSSYRWDTNVLNQELARAKANLDDVLNGSNLSDNVALQVAKSRLAVDQSRVRLQDARTALDNARIAVDDAKIVVKDAQKAVADAKKALDEAKNASPEIRAPFSGFVTRVNVKGGDEVKKGTVAVTIADPAKFEAEVMVGELDILKVKLDGVASVQAQAVPGVSFPAKVTSISPTATIQSGVVNYKVKVEITSLQPVTQQQTRMTGFSSNNTSPGAPSGGFRQQPSGDNTTGGFRRSTAGDNMTQEQMSQVIQQRQQMSQTGPSSGQITQIPVMEEVKLIDGLSVTVSITVTERNNVLIVPVQAVISQGGKTLVQVSVDGVIGERPVTVGISNFQYAEITGGLDEGEQVVLPRATASSAPTTSRQGQPVMMPGLGGIRR